LELEGFLQTKIFNWLPKECRMVMSGNNSGSVDNGHMGYVIGYIRIIQLYAANGHPFQGALNVRDVCVRVTDFSDKDLGEGSGESFYRIQVLLFQELDVGIGAYREYCQDHATY
jgi:hypothetical protein